jgi:hypothetical protein
MLTNSYSGIETWSGFFTGVGEDMSDPLTGRQVFLNNYESEFYFTIDKDNGTFQGTMSGYDINGSASISNMVIGGNTSNSAYLTDSMLAATLSGSNVIYNGSDTASLKSYGNYMVTSRETPLSSYTTWGYWEAAYVDPATSNDYHIHIPGSFWIAGVVTDDAVVSGLTFHATYNGKAQGVMFSQAMALKKMTNGTCELNIDFTGHTVSGSIKFDEISLVLNSGYINTSGFSAQIDNASVSQVSGAFYGPNAEGIGGNFSAEINTTKYLGIFAGDR